MVGNQDYVGDIKFLCTRNEILINRKNKYLIIKDQKKIDKQIANLLLIFDF